MNTSRYNSFNQIHKGLRAALFDTTLKLQQADLSDATSGREAVDQVEEILMLFESHAHSEDHFFNEPLEAVDPTISKLFQKEHEEDHRLGIVLSALIAQWKSVHTPESRHQTGRQLLYAFHEFAAFNLYHMNKEEIELNAALWRQYTDQEIKAIEQSLVQQVPPQKMAAYAKWMIKGINDQELLHWLKEVRMFAPPELFGMLNDMAQSHLTAVRYERLGEGLRAA